MTAQPKPVGKNLKIILDSNALFVPLQFNIDIFEALKDLLNRNYEPTLLSSTHEELERMVDQGTSEMRKKADYALKLAEKCKLLKMNGRREFSSDDLIVLAAKKYRYPVFTNDRELRKRLRDINVPVIYVRQKSRLDIDGSV